jgi:hypothetical protein
VSSAGTIEVVAIELSKLLRPLATDTSTPGRTKAFFAQMGFTLNNALYGSPALREHLGHSGTATDLEELRGCAHIDEVIERIGGNERVRTLLREIPT